MTHSTPRGRPRHYDRDTALDQITQVFWKHGFAATSLDMISEAAGMKRPSLYAAFGDKQAMFLLTQTRFAEKLSKELSEILKQPAPPSIVLNTFFERLIEIYTGNANQQTGCFVFSVGLIEATTEKDIGALIKQAYMSMQEDIEFALERAVASGQLQNHGNTTALSELLVALGHSLAIRARSGEEPTDLRKLAERTIKQLLTS